jgi:hypothetical protein
MYRWRGGYSCPRSAAWKLCPADVSPRSNYPSPLLSLSANTETRISVVSTPEPPRRFVYRGSPLPVWNSISASIPPTSRLCWSPSSLAIPCHHTRSSHRRRGAHEGPQPYVKRVKVGCRLRVFQTESAHTRIASRSRLCKPRHDFLRLATDTAIPRTRSTYQLGMDPVVEENCAGASQRRARRLRLLGKKRTGPPC